MPTKYIVTVTIHGLVYRFNVYDAPGDFRITATLPDSTTLYGSEAARLFEALLMGPAKIYGYDVKATPGLVVPVEARSWRPRVMSEINVVETKRLGILYANGNYKIVVEAQAVTGINDVKSYGTIRVEELVPKLTSSMKSCIDVADAGIVLSTNVAMLYVTGGLERLHSILIKPRGKHTITVFDASVRTVPQHGVLIEIARKIAESIESSGDLEELYKLRYAYIYLYLLEKEITYSIITYAKAMKAAKHFLEMLTTGIASQYGYTYRRVKLPTK